MLNGSFNLITRRLVTLKWIGCVVGVFSSLTKMEFQPSTLTCLRMQQVESAGMSITPFTSLLSGQAGRIGNAY